MPGPSRCYAITPFFIVDDVVKSAEYYRDVLGFRFDRIWGEPPCFVIVGRDSIEIMLSSAAGPGHVRPNHQKHTEAGWDAYIRVSDGTALYEEFKAKGARIIRDPQVTFYQMREFEVQDCNGYVLCFGQDTSQEHPTQTTGESIMAKSNVKAIPAGYHTVTPYLVVKSAAEAIEFYKKAFGAVELVRHPGAGGQGIMHAQIRIGDSTIMMGDEHPHMGGKSPATLGAITGSLYLYVEDVDAAFQKAVGAGAKGDFPPGNMFWGDRMCSVTDPFGHVWALATHIEDVPIEDMDRRRSEFFASMAKKRG